jgi:hypothetical protein
MIGFVMFVAIGTVPVVGEERHSGFTDRIPSVMRRIPSAIPRNFPQCSGRACSPLGEFLCAISGMAAARRILRRPNRQVFPSAQGILCGVRR